MSEPRTLTLIGYWDGPDTVPGWPKVHDFIDTGWDDEERDLVATYLGTGLIAAAMMGYSRCRICGRQVGCLELTDGRYVWPEGLAHYVAEHHVRLPDPFVRHVVAMMDSVESSQRDVGWWQHARPNRRR